MARELKRMDREERGGGPPNGGRIGNWMLPKGHRSAITRSTPEQDARYAKQYEDLQAHRAAQARRQARSADALARAQAGYDYFGGGWTPGAVAARAMARGHTDIDWAKLKSPGVAGRTDELKKKDAGRFGVPGSAEEPVNRPKIAGSSDRLYADPEGYVKDAEALRGMRAGTARHENPDFTRLASRATVTDALRGATEGTRQKSWQGAGRVDSLNDQSELAGKSTDELIGTNWQAEAKKSVEGLAPVQDATVQKPDNTPSNPNMEYHVPDRPMTPEEQEKSRVFNWGSGRYEGENNDEDEEDQGDIYGGESTGPYTTTGPRTTGYGTTTLQRYVPFSRSFVQALPDDPTRLGGTARTTEIIASEPGRPSEVVSRDNHVGDFDLSARYREFLPGQAAGFTVGPENQILRSGSEVMRDLGRMQANMLNTGRSTYSIVAKVGDVKGGAASPFMRPRGWLDAALRGAVAGGRTSRAKARVLKRGRR